jgi:single-strand DNA-binding protein
MAMGDAPITVIGNLTSDPELKSTPSGAALAKFTVASTPATSTANQASTRTAPRCSCAAPPGAASPNTSPNPGH